MNFCTKLIGIVNITPDSLSGSFQPYGVERVLKYIDSLFTDGASVVDIGAESTNPQSKEVSLEEERARLLQVLGPIFNTFPQRIFSLDTRKAETASLFLEMGGSIINDYAGLINNNLIGVVIAYRCQYIVNHFPGRNIQEVHSREKIDSLVQVKADLLERKKYLVERGIQERQIILDPGIGFAKSASLNWELLGFKDSVPSESVCIGYSKKRFLGNDRFGVEVNRQAGMIALKTQPDYIRLHEPQILIKGEKNE
ncbi:MAG: dihydropteroate synthase [Patescibacteria group bacterium]